MKRAWLLLSVALIGTVGSATAAEATTSAPWSELTKTIAFERDSVQPVPGPFEVWWLAFSADDQLLAASGGGAWNNQFAGQARIWEFGKAKEVASYSTPRGIVSVTFSPDGRRVALCSWTGDIWLREIGGAELMHEKFGLLLRAVFSPDGKLLVGATERSQLRTWDGLTGKSIGKDPFRGDMFPFLWVGFSPNGEYLIATGTSTRKSGDINLAVWNVASRQQLYKKSAGPERIFWAAISPDSQTLATSSERSVVLRDLATGARRSETEDTDGEVFRLEFSPDGSLLATAGGNTHEGDVTLWDPSTGKAVGTLAGHRLDVYAMAFTHDGKTLATAGADRSIRLWDVATRQQKTPLQESKTQPDADGVARPVAITAVAYSPDGNHAATASDDGEVSIYRLAPPGLVRSWPAHADVAAAIAWSPDGKTIVTAGYDKLVKFWNPETGELLRTLTGHTGWVVSLAISRDGQRLASGSYDRTIRLWNVADGSERQTLTGHSATVRSLAFSHDDKLLASASADRTVRLWDAASGQEQATLTGHEGAVRCVAFSGDDRLLASGGEDRTLKIWNVESHDLRGTLSKHTDVVSAVAFAQQTLVSTSWDHTLRTWDAGALLLRGKITVGPSEVVALAVAPDGQHLLSASADQSLTLWKPKIAKGQRGGAALEMRKISLGYRISVGLITNDYLALIGALVENDHWKGILPLGTTQIAAITKLDHLVREICAKAMLADADYLDTRPSFYEAYLKRRGERRTETVRLAQRMVTLGLLTEPQAAVVIQRQLSEYGGNALWNVSVEDLLGVTVDQKRRLAQIGEASRDRSSKLNWMSVDPAEQERTRELIAAMEAGFQSETKGVLTPAQQEIWNRFAAAPSLPAEPPDLPDRSSPEAKEINLQAISSTFAALKEEAVARELSADQKKMLQDLEEITRDGLLWINLRKPVESAPSTDVGKEQANQFLKTRAEFVKLAEQIALLGILTEVQAEQVNIATKSKRTTSTIKSAPPPLDCSLQPVNTIEQASL